MNGNSELTETENILRKLRSTFGTLTDERNNAYTYFATEMTTATDTERWKPGVRVCFEVTY